MHIDALKQSGLLKQKQIYHPRRKQINSMSLSGVFCVLLAASPVLEATMLLQSLQTIIAFTLWWPQPGLDSEDVIELIRGSRTEQYHINMQLEARKYVEEVNNVSVKYPSLKRFPDEPKLHRFLELYHHSISLLGHVREFAELVFEHVHQPLKRCIARSNNKRPQLSAV